MASTKKSQFGELPPRHSFMLNPYPDQRISRCPLCENKTGQRKIPLLIHVDPSHLIALNHTCRYCRDCDLLIGHKCQIEHSLTESFRQSGPTAIGNTYLIIGTMEKGTWREGLAEPKALGDVLPHVSDFAKYYQELRVTSPGWYRAEQEPPVIEPPPSQEWVKLASSYRG
jgi:hypothetical protein